MTSKERNIHVKLNLRSTYDLKERSTHAKLNPLNLTLRKINNNQYTDLTFNVSIYSFPLFIYISYRIMASHSRTG